MLVVTDETWRKSRGNLEYNAEGYDQEESKAPGKTPEKLLAKRQCDDRGPTEKWGETVT